ncbi:hypothetical protein [Chryseobacterium luteum]|uniref:hypothetical protein n=1 Tax=Chryseobacterium luteum TaxID=421531 RepID=UPI0006920A59|nr:hypothetical protein [Chryseobacterium luteum]
MTDIKNQNTLYRFVSLRNPERSKKEKQEHSFVFHPEDNKKIAETNSGKFFDAVKNKTAAQTKWQALKAVSFTGFATENDLEKSNLSFFTASDWLARNRTTASASEIYTKAKEYIELTPPVELNLWDNLFYKIITNDNFYVKDGLIQMLIFQNLLKQIKKITGEQNILAVICTLANAKVVLPAAVFEESQQATAGAGAMQRVASDDFSDPKILQDVQNIVKSKFDLERLENAKAELLKIEKKQRTVNQNHYETAQRNYQIEIKPLLDDYQRDYNNAKRALIAAEKDTPANLKLIDVPYPKLPEFQYDNPIEIEQDVIKGKLSENSRTVLDEIIDLREAQTFEEIYEAINDNIKTANKTIVSSTKFSEQYASFGDMVFPVNKDASAEDNYIFRICSDGITGNRYAIRLYILDPSLNVAGILYKLKLQDGTFVTNTAFTSSIINGIVTIKLFDDNGYTQNPANPVVDFSAEIKTSNNVYYILDVDGFTLSKSTSCSTGALVEKNTGNGTNDAITKGFGYRQLGIADYKKVVSEICCYDAGEVAHIENVMASEFRNKTTERKRVEENTVTQETQQETENLTDTSTTERFEMQTEIAKLLKEQKEFNAHVDVHSSWGNTTLDAGAAYATNVSKEESNRQAVTQAKELTQRAMERIVSKIRQETVQKTTESFTETNSHIFDNRGSAEHISGVYRFINATYKNQIYNYGKRLMYEFMVPQPSKLHRLGLMEVGERTENMSAIQKPVDPRTTNYHDFLSIEKHTYHDLAAQYGATVEVYPEESIYINKTFSCAIENATTEMQAGSKEIAIPKGYKTYSATLKCNAKSDGDSGGHSIGVTFGSYNLMMKPGTGNGDFTEANFNIQPSGTPAAYSLDGYTEKMEISYSSVNYLTFNIAFSVKAVPTDETINNWKKNAYDAIIRGYEEQLRLYNESVVTIKEKAGTMLESNPGFYRQTEQLILKKNCISYLIDDANPDFSARFGQLMYNKDATFKDHQVKMSQDMDDYTSFAKFMEQAFEWNLMSYNFYPFYWGNREEWKDLYQYDSNDPIYRSFMQAGMARVVVTVKPGFEDAVMHYMAFKQIWNGGQMPVLGNPLYISIVEELKEQEYVVEETWETVLPTSLIAIQEKGVAVAGEGLPCSNDCVEHTSNTLKANDNKMGVILPTK